MRSQGVILPSKNLILCNSNYSSPLADDYYELEIADMQKAAFTVSLTLTMNSISLKTWSTGTIEAANCVSADGSKKAVVQTLSTLINVCRVRLKLIETRIMNVVHKINKQLFLCEMPV